MIEEIYKAYTIEEALSILNNNKNIAILNGGTDLIVNIRNNKVDKKVLLDISDIKQLKEIIVEEQIIKIGGGVTFNQLMKSEKIGENLYGLRKAASLIGSPQIRGRGTIGGNICNNSPSADIIPPLLALDSTIVIQSKNNLRRILLKDFLLDKNKTDLKEDELLTYIEIKIPKNNQTLGFSKLGYRKSLAISKICASVYIENENNKFKDIKIALGALNSTAIRAYEVEDYLIDKEISKDNINEALYILEKIVSNDLRGRDSGYFKSNAVKGVVETAIEECLDTSKRVIL